MHRKREITGDVQLKYNVRYDEKPKIKSKTMKRKKGDRKCRVKKCDGGEGEFVQNDESIRSVRSFTCKAHRTANMRIRLMTIEPHPLRQ